MRKQIVAAALMCLATASQALDYDDHEAICAAVEANTTHWSGGGKEKFRKTCPCEVAYFAGALDADEFKMAMDMKIDARSFAKNLPDGVDPTAFMAEMIPMGLQASQACS